MKGVNIFKNDHRLRGNAKRQKPEVLTSTKIGELSDNPSERKVNVDIVLLDKQEAYLKDIYQRMSTKALELISSGDHKKAFEALR